MKQSYKNVHLLIEHTWCNKHSWCICGYFEVIAHLDDLELTYAECCCVLCEWDDSAQKKSLLTGTVANFTSTDYRGKRREDGSQPFVILALPYNNLGAIKSTFKAVNESGSGCLLERDISEDQKDVNQTIFVGLQIK